MIEWIIKAILILLGAFLLIVFYAMFDLSGQLSQQEREEWYDEHGEWPNW